MASIVRFMRQWPVLPLIIFGLLLLCAVFAPLIANHDPEYGDLRKKNVPPSWSEEGSVENLLGTDALGRDIFSRLVFGARLSIVIAAVVLSTGAVGGTILGMIAGYFGGVLDELIMRAVEVTIIIPFILVALVVVIIWGQSLSVILALLAMSSWAGFARQTRAETLQLKVNDYVAQAKVVGASTPRIMIKHILPGTLNTLLVLCTLQVGSLILTESILSFLGVGIPPPTPAWGVMVADGRGYLSTAWWISFFPGIAIFLTVFSMNFLGDWLRDRFDPRLRQLV